jgi:beta-glucosidase
MMAEATFSFPADFRWGTATSSHQVEGNNTLNDWWAWEQEGQRLLDGRTFDNQTSGLACNWWADAESDIARMVEMGQNAHRMSVEWSRIEPTPAVWDEDAVDRYRQILGVMRDAGIEPMVTLHHFTNPQWMAERGGWANDESAVWFGRYVRKIVDSLSDLVDLWCTVNEPGILAAQGYNRGVWPPGETSTRLYFQVSLNLLRAHAAAYEIIHELQEDARVGLAKAMQMWQPRRSRFPGDRLAARLIDNSVNGVFIQALMEGVWRTPGRRARPVPELRNTLDWWGINYYHRFDAYLNPLNPSSLFLDLDVPSGVEIGPGEWGEIYPAGLYKLLGKAKAYKLPLYVTENGRPDEKDQNRPRFIVEHLHHVWRALQIGAPVMGYYHWSLVDNFEWAEGYNPEFRFGLIELDVETQERRVKTSGELYAEICRTGTLTSDMARRFAPEALESVFPGEAPPSS